MIWFMDFAIRAARARSSYRRAVMTHPTLLTASAIEKRLRRLASGRRSASEGRYVADSMVYRPIQGDHDETVRCRANFRADSALAGCLLAPDRDRRDA